MNETLENLSLDDGPGSIPRLPLNETMMTILLLSEQPFLAVDGSIGGRAGSGSEERSCYLVRLGERWARA